jgi:pimeloyl-ACP methyl ester carboxylesterase
VCDDPAVSRRLFPVLAVTVILAACGSAPPTRSAPPSAAPTSPATPAASTGPRFVALADGRKMELECAGSGPVVIMDAGLGNTMDVWFGVLPFLDGATVCRYNRAGLGASDPRPEPHGSVSAVADLHELLGAARLKPPWVVVGASFGGLNANLFARTYPKDVAGVVLVDAISPKWNAGLEALLPPALVAARHAIPNGEPISNDDLRASDAALAAAPPFPAVKLVVLRHGRPFPPIDDDPAWPTEGVEALWTTLQDELATLSPTSVEILAGRSGHRIHQDEPRLVADAIMAIVDPSRWPPGVP